MGVKETTRLSAQWKWTNEGREANPIHIFTNTFMTLLNTHPSIHLNVSTNHWGSFVGWEYCYVLCVWFSRSICFITSSSFATVLAHTRIFWRGEKKKFFCLFYFWEKKNKKKRERKKYFLFCFVCQENRKNIVDIHKWNNNENFYGILSLRKIFLWEFCARCGL